MHDLISFGEITLDTIGVEAGAAAGAAELTQLGTTYGGRGANAATFFAAWRGAAALVSAAGEDFVRSGHRHVMEQRGVDCADVLIESQRETPRAFVFQSQNAARTFFYRAESCEAAQRMEAHVRDVAQRRRATILYCTSGTSALNLLLLTQLRCTLKVYAPGPQVLDASTSELVSLLQSADVLFLSEQEARHVYLQTGLGAEQLNRAYQLQFHVVTCGAAGCAIRVGGQEHHLRACRPDVTVDPTGAGDGFAGAFLAEYLRTGDAISAGRLAVVASSFVVEKLGCQERLPSPAQLEERLREYQIGER